MSDADSSITISDIRVLENRQGQQWVALPSYAVSKGGKDYSYLPTIELTASLTRELTSRVLEAFEQWNAGGASMSANPLLSQSQLVPGASPQIIGEASIEPNASVTPASESEVQKMEHLLRWGRIQYLPPAPWNDGHQWRISRCVFNPNHSNVFVAVNALGKTFYTCSNDACHENHWEQFIELLKKKNSPEAQIARIEEETRQKEEPDLPESTQPFPPFPRLIGVLDDLASAIAPSLAYEQKALALLTIMCVKYIVAKIYDSRFDT